jgi:hypothetical protein
MDNSGGRKIILVFLLTEISDLMAHKLQKLNCFLNQIYAYVGTECKNVVSLFLLLCLYSQILLPK